MEIYPVISTRLHPNGPLRLVVDLSSLIGAELIDQHLFFGFLVTGLQGSQIELLRTVTRLSVLPLPNSTLLISGTLYNWSATFKKLLTKDSELQELLCRIFFLLEQTDSKSCLESFNKIKLPNGSFYVS